jgi:limonene-1,2-epoxide hydrolase
MSRRLFTRRTMLATTTGALFASSVSTNSEAGKINPSEEPNVRLVNDFMRGWAAVDATGSKQAAFFADNCVVRLQEGKPAIQGKEALVAAFDAYLKKGARFEIKVSSSCAKGPVVINSRTDAPIIKGIVGKGISVVGVFIVRGGKIMEQWDFLP